MPLHVWPTSRRQFLTRSAAAAASVAVVSSAWAGEDVDANRFALLSDTHIPEHPEIEARGVNMTAHLRHVVAQLCELQPRPAGVIINGDCAYLKGLPPDYVNLATSLQPLAQAELPLHLTMGNHDDRGPFYHAFSAQRPEQPPVQSKHISVIRSPHANLFLLDSLREVNVVTGELGEAQRDWLARALDQHDDKPAIIVAHHNLQFESPAQDAAWSGLKDSAQLFDLLAKRRHVKAYVFGHTHDWRIDERDGIHLINLPPVAYVFSDGKPSGWVQAVLHADSIDLELSTINPSHPQAGQKVSLAWR